MNILAIDSCTQVASCAILKDGVLVAEQYMNHKKSHSKKLLPMVERAFLHAEMTVGDIDLFACTAGPGSFTGQRIGIATIKGLAQAFGKPCVGVSSLEATAYNLPFTDKYICPIMDARRDQVYNGVYRWVDGRCETVKGDRAIALDELIEEMKGKDAIFLGDGVIPFKDRLTAFHIAPPNLSQITASSVALLAMRKETVSVNELVPLYLRVSQAERLYKEKINTLI